MPRVLSPRRDSPLPHAAAPVQRTGANLSPASICCPPAPAGNRRAPSCASRAITRKLARRRSPASPGAGRPPTCSMLPPAELAFSGIALDALGPACRPPWQWRLAIGRCTRFHRAHERTEAEGRAVRTSGWVIPALVPRAAFEPVGGGITSCRPAGIPGARFVLAQEFEGVMT